MIRLAVFLGLIVLPVMAQESLGFVSPSGNIACVIDMDYVRCDIATMTHQDFTDPPPDCDLDYGASFGIGAGDDKGSALCYGDTVFMPDLPVLDYDQAIDQGGIECLSQKTGLVCTNATGHGFEISKGRQTLF